ncbi:MAG: FIST C-terminal domain-containing protein [Defluviitaleaceae bacterium]|nr:FIST C-terminal domain-containing protein [Defluviitaleaceae bacterium]
MLKCANAYTHEIDNPEAAFKEIKAQLDERITLQENSIGIIMCHPEFVNSDTLRYVCDHMLFEVVGITTPSQAVNNTTDEMILTVFVITSDDCQFKIGLAEGLDENITEPIKTAMEKTALKNCGYPALVLIFPPLILKYSGDSYVKAMQEFIPGIPIFGSIAIDDTLDFDLAETIYNGETYKNAMPFILCYGDINPRFIIGTFPEENALPYKGEITKSQGSLVHEINDMNALKYFESKGLVNNGILSDSFNLMPFVINHEKRTGYSVIRGLAMFTDDGTAVFRGDIDEGSEFSMLTYEFKDVLSTTQQKIELLNDLPDVNGALIFSCIGRRMMIMSTDPIIELDTVRDVIRPEIPFIASHVGGEICPLLVNDGVWANKYHNYSLIILVI